MGLDYRQKNYIKRNLRHFPVSKIAEDLEISESEVLDYLKKKWTRDKYEKFLRNREAAESATRREISAFSFSHFISENRFVILLLAGLVLVSYANSFFNGFVSDDIAGFLRNPNIGKFSTVTGNPMHFSLPAFFQFIAYHIGGLHPFTLRIINIFSHLGVVILIFAILNILSNRRVAIISASLFAVHPILIESVSWISGGLYSIYAFFFLLSFLFYLLSKNNQKYIHYSIAFYVLSVFSSEKAIPLFLVFFLYELAYGGIKLNWKKMIPYFSVSVVLALIYVAKIGTRVSDVEAMSYQQGGGGLFNPLIQIPVAISSYLGLIFWPGKLTLYHTEMAFPRGEYILMIFAVLIFIGMIFYGYKKNKAIFFWLTFFVIALLPTLTPFKISWIVAERYVYLSSLGIFVVIALFFDKLTSFNRNAKMVVYTVLVIVIAALSTRTIVRNLDWKSEDTLWIATGKTSPSGQTTHNNLGDVFAREGDLAKSAEEFKKAIELNPNYADAYHNLANTYQQMGQLDLAVENYQKAVSINPKLWQSYQNLSAIAFNKGDYQTALNNIEKAVEIDPQNQQLQDSLKAIQGKIGT